MSDRESTEPYVYQPEPIDPRSATPVHEQRLWALGGLGLTEEQRARRYSKLAASTVLAGMRRLAGHA